MTTIIRPANWTAERASIRAVREEVFIHEQKVDPDIEWDDQEETAQHFLVLEDDLPVGTGRITAAGKIGRMAILKSVRGNGLGFRLLEAICAHAREAGMHQVYLHAQRHAEGFYRKAGFVAEGPEFVEANIPHIKMVRHFD